MLESAKEVIHKLLHKGQGGATRNVCVHSPYQNKKRDLAIAQNLHTTAVKEIAILDAKKVLDKRAVRLQEWI